MLRCLSDIQEADPTAKIHISYFDLTLDNIRDLIKHTKKEQIKLQSMLAVNFSEKIFGGKDAKG